MWKKELSKYVSCKFFSRGIKTMQCTSHSLQNKLQDNAESSDTCISKCL